MSATETSSPESPNRLAQATAYFLKFSLLFLILLFISSVFEIILASSDHNLKSGILSLIKWASLENLAFWLRIALPAYLIFSLVYLVSRSLAFILSNLAIILFFSIHLLLIYYYNTTLVMLGGDIFGYSLAEITQTVGASGTLAVVPVMIFLVFISLVIAGILFIRKRIFFPPVIGLLVPVLSAAYIFVGWDENVQPKLETDFETKLAENKSEHFYNAAYRHFEPELYETDIYAESYVKNYLAGDDVLEPVEYVDEFNYPFLRKSTGHDVLGPYFETKQKKPNLVFILVEGLGRAFTNKNAELGNFTPFLDELSDKSLYWPNFLSGGGRTFAVLPSIFGSLPFGKTGFMELDQMPSELSLFNVLQKNDYQTAFYYGGNSTFDNMNRYLKANEVNRILDEPTFPEAYQKIPPSAGGFTWGYGDKELYRYYLNSVADDTTAAPYLNVILTVSTHDPFSVNDQERYNERFEQRLEEIGFRDELKEEYSKYKKQYASILFMDDAMKEFFEAYSKRADFNNTIFFITGDHRIPEIPMTSKIDRYHVPLMVYSPMLKRTAQIESISSHFDITPSVLAFMHEQYGIQTPLENAFVGQGLDTLRNFRNIHPIALKQTKTDFRDFVMGNYHLNGNSLYQIQPDMKEILVNNPEKKAELQNAFDQFRRKNEQIIEGKKLIPDSLKVYGS
ncbi:MAG: sulfatase-like hydrolase/transferase [Christiangramia sp.]|uniref:LTA synthase family protein n=1 Tax=Christiangramia sp. TaxID=1931228 RepID=UPI003242C4F9